MPRQGLVDAHDGLVRLDFHDVLVALDFVARLHGEAHDGGFGDGFAELRHDDGNLGHVKTSEIKSTIKIRIKRERRESGFFS